ncbi:glycosyltransferase family 4 protein [Curtobacterium sp. RRHDQ66]|uniref:glycosyltransferase family 4 protein n=1 Tax=Curtobacterium guangdongense TaxID=3413380 RepID=UPI003BF40C14
MKTVWIVNHYAHHHERDGRSTRHEHFAAGLAPDWHTVVIAAGTDHPTGRSHLHGVTLRRRWFGDGYQFCWLRGVDHRGSGRRRAVRRVADILLFSMLLLLPGVLRGLPRPDVIVGSSFHPLAAIAASALARRRGVPFVFEPRDLWPESAIGLAGMHEHHPAIRLLRRIERVTVRRAVHLISPLEGVGRYYEDRVPFTWVPNGVAPDTEPLPPRHPDADFSVTYIGSMGPANALETVLDGFDLAHRRAAAAGGPRLALVLVGDGADASRLRERASGLQSARSIIWTGRVPQAEARRIGRQAGCLVVTMHALPIYQHGVSMNKQYEYMLLGRPLLVGAPVPIAPVNESRCGVQVAADSPAALATGMLAMATSDPAVLDAMGARGREHVLREYDYRLLAERYGRALSEALR